MLGNRVIFAVDFHRSALGSTPSFCLQDTNNEQQANQFLGGALFQPENALEAGGKRAPPPPTTRRRCCNVSFTP